MMLQEDTSGMQFDEPDEDEVKYVEHVVPNGDTFWSLAKTKAPSKDTKIFAITPYAKKGKTLDSSVQEKVHYLPVSPLKNRATYMFFGKYKKADPRIFVTTTLSGCDVWIGRCIGAQPEYFAVHIHSNEIVGVDNLKFKEDAAMSIQALLGKQTGKTCTFLDRYAHDWNTYHKDDNDKEEKLAGLDEYWEKFINDHGDIGVRFYSKPMLFYMVFNEKTQSWRVKFRYLLVPEYVLI